MVTRFLHIGLMLTALSSTALAAEHVTLTNGFAMDCARHEAVAETGMIRLYLLNASGSSYMDVPAASVQSVEPLTDIPVAHAAQAHPPETKAPAPTSVTGLLTEAGAKHHIDVDLLAAVVKAESGGNIRAVSHAGARGLMQLMPGTAAGLGVKDAFKPEDNIAGGTTYLDQLLTRYHDDVALALAAYNAGPGAVDRWHGVPPYRETRAYVTRIINEFNRRKTLAVTAR